MGILLSAPVSAVPVLTVGTIASGQFIALQLSHLKHLGVVELDIGVTSAPVVFVDGFG